MISSVAMVAAMMAAGPTSATNVHVDAEGLRAGVAPRVTLVHIDTQTQQMIDTVDHQSIPTPAPASPSLPGNSPATPPAAQPQVVIAPPENSTQSQTDATADQGNQIVVQGQAGAPSEDPAEQVNAATYKVVQELDEAVVEPIAQAYDKGMPKPFRTGLSNFIANLGEPINFLNFMLQLKPGKALKSVGRFAINSTIGIAGVMDPASKKPFHLRHETNGFGNTLGYYGVGQGPYLYLPFIGSTTVRDLTGRIIDLSIIPMAVGKPFNQPLFAISVGTLNTLETRIEIDGDIKAIREQCGDQYAASRDLYLIQRQIEIDSLRGKQSKQLAELIDRLEFNCDITLLMSGAIDHEVESRQSAESLVAGSAAQPKTTEGVGETPSAEPAQLPAQEVPPKIIFRPGTGEVDTNPASDFEPSPVS